MKQKASLRFDDDEFKSLTETAYEKIKEENTIIRASLEGLAARFAACKALDEDREGLKRQIEIMRERTNKAPVQKIVEANTRFHFLIHKAGKNPYVGRLIDVIKNFDRNFRDRALADRQEALRGFREHLSVYEAVLARDGELAEARMKKHILRTLDFILKEKK